MCTKGIIPDELHPWIQSLSVSEAKFKVDNSEDDSD